jgi:putative membrane protein
MDITHMKSTTLITIVSLIAAASASGATTRNNNSGTGTGNTTQGTSSNTSNSSNSSGTDNSTNNNGNNGSNSNNSDNGNNNNGNNNGNNGNTGNGVQGANNNSSNGSLIGFDNRWLSKAAAGSLQEITVGGLAETNSTNADVQAFGARLVEDHSAAYQMAQQLAETNGVTIPTQLNSLQQHKVQLLAGLTGSAFDAAFLRLMVRDHIQDIQLYETEAVRGRNADLRAYARAQLPILMDHLIIALELEESLGLTPPPDAVKGGLQG